MSGFVSLTAWRKPAIQLSTGGILIPPTVDTVFVFVTPAATMPARYPASSDGNWRPSVFGIAHGAWPSPPQSGSAP